MSRQRLSPTHSPVGSMWWKLAAVTTYEVLRAVAAARDELCVAVLASGNQNLRALLDVAASPSEDDVTRLRAWNQLCQDAWTDPPNSAVREAAGRYAGAVARQFDP
jgi:hypothetical protein